MMPCLVMVARLPVAGQVKSRIAATLGEADALALYRCALADSVLLMRESVGAHLAISYTPDHAEARREFSRIAPGFTLLAQRGPAFGERLFNTFVDLRAQALTPIVLIGSDSPSLPPHCLATALDAIARPDVDVVLGPAHDGGYYLLALKEPQQALFDGISWGTSAVAQETRDTAARCGLRLVEAPAWYDLDTESDLQRLLADVSTTNDGRALNTRACIEAIFRR
ncbi:MAG: TIGR04282 family arsenosugar biosynthesis glycosyltransferase [Pseudomonadota bacterium]|nr:TIGR04282 family arsenosugar biosynthesis glycosyltransferase [Pseudomonadota bacterium]